MVLGFGVSRVKLGSSHQLKPVQHARAYCYEKVSLVQGVDGVIFGYTGSGVNMGKLGETRIQKREKGELLCRKTGPRGAHAVVPTRSNVLAHAVGPRGKPGKELSIAHRQLSRKGSTT